MRENTAATIAITMFDFGGAQAITITRMKVTSPVNQAQKDPAPMMLRKPTATREIIQMMLHLYPPGKVLDENKHL